MANTTDPDSRNLRTGDRYVQGYNAQAAVSGDQVVVAAEVGNARNDTTMFAPMVRAAELNLSAAGACSPYFILADTGYWSAENLDLEVDAEVLIAPRPVTSGTVTSDDPSIARRGEVLDRVEAGSLSILQAAEDLGISGTWVRRLLANRRNHLGDPSVYRKDMLARLNSDEGRVLYAKRKITVEPVFGNIKANLRCRRFSGRGMQAVNSEWRLICAVHNLLKLRTRRLVAG